MIVYTLLSPWTDFPPSSLLILIFFLLFTSALGINGTNFPLGSIVKKSFGSYFQRDYEIKESQILEGAEYHSPPPCVVIAKCDSRGINKEEFREYSHSNKAISSIRDNFFPPRKATQTKKFEDMKSRDCPNWLTCNCTCNCCCFLCIKISKLAWYKLVAAVVLLAVLLITAEFTFDTSFCYFNPVVPLTLIPLLDPVRRGKQ